VARRLSSANKKGSVERPGDKLRRSPQQDAVKMLVRAGRSAFQKDTLDDSLDADDALYDRTGDTPVPSCRQPNPYAPSSLQVIDWVHCAR